MYRATITSLTLTVSLSLSLNEFSTNFVVNALVVAAVKSSQVAGADLLSLIHGR